MDTLTAAPRETAPTGLNGLPKFMGNKDESGKSETGWKIALALLATLIAIQSALLGFCLTQVVELRAAVQGIQASRFTANDGMRLMETIAQLQSSIATIPKEIPPKWFVEKVDRMDARMERIEAKLNSVK